MHIKPKQKLECALYVVATPIGNLSDITLRALEVLGEADTIAAEDTRNTRHLLQHHGIGDARLLALHQHNERGAAEKVIALLQQGQNVALVTDAGTPAVSDPGAVLVETVLAAGFRVIPIPGASAAVAALSASGMCSPHFLFYGFLPNKSTARRTALQALIEHPYTLVFYEAPHRILECTEDLHAVFGAEREIVFAREITKLFESIHRCKLDEAMDWLNSDPNNQRGEFVLMVSGAALRRGNGRRNRAHARPCCWKSCRSNRRCNLRSRSRAANKNELYQRALALKAEPND